MTLCVTNHDRDSTGMTYVYAVVSRRARGVSVGVNLNPNNACNWRCIYCQVPDLVRGSGPEVDLDTLEAELRRLLEDIVHGDFMDRRVPATARRLRDVALSGNGEPTSSPQFVEAVELIGEVLRELELLGSVELVLITNGSLLHRAAVRQGVARLAQLGGEIWFKLDSVTAEGARRIHSVPLDPARQLARLGRVAELCPTRIQTCLFACDGAPPSPREQQAYLDCMRALVQEGVPVRGVLLYGLARPSQQPEAGRLSPLSGEWLKDFARRIEATGMPVSLSV